MLKQFALREGWTTFFLTSMLVFISVWSIRQADWADGLQILNLIMLVGLVTGLIVAKQRWVPGFVAQGLALLVGVVVVLFQMTQYLDDSLGSRREKLAWLLDRGERWVSLIAHGQSTDDLYLFIVFISAVTFQLSFATVWFVFRARWIWAAMVFPGLLLFINLGYSLRVPTGLVVLYLFFALLLLVRFTVLERELLWRRLRVEYPSSLAWRGMWVATYLAVVILMFGWIFPTSAQSGRVHDAWLSVNGPWRSIEQQVNKWFAGLRGPGSFGIGGYASFGDSFDLGGPLRLSDTPVVLVTGQSQAPYLAAHRYSVYTGHGWKSENAPDEDSDTVSVPVMPQVELPAGQAVDVSNSAKDTRNEKTYTLRVERPRGALVYSPEVFYNADIGVNLVVSWRTVTDQTIDLTGDLPADVPDELQHLATMLQAYDFSPPEPTPLVDVTETPEEGATPTPEPTVTPEPPAPASPAIVGEQQSLQERGITTQYAVDPTTYQATSLTYSGTFPDFSDVEAVYAHSGFAPGDQYQVTALTTRAKSDDLRKSDESAAPSSITEEYLQLPATVTDRTRALAHQITDGQPTAYDKAKAIETYLRQNIAYSEDVDVPPEDTDVVDYLLFTSHKGYCEYYASAFIVMAREIGLPARMVTGFFPADRDAAAGGFLYRELNAHAWPEVYFQGYGWVSFEPTAQRPEINRDPLKASPAVGRISPESGGVGNTLPDDSQFLNDQGGLDNRFGAAGAGTSQAAPVTRAEWALRGGFLALMLATVALVYLWLRGMRGLTPTGQLYAKVVRGAAWGGVRQHPAMTPHEYANVLAKDVPGSRLPATYLADLYVRETYSQQPIAQSEMLRARHAWVRLRGLLVKHFFVRLRPWGSSEPEQETTDDRW